MPGNTVPRYPLGSSQDELARLDLQGAALAPATRTILAAAGLRRGMRVLDLGSGAGDVAFAAAELAGPGGHILGIDSSPQAVARATARARARGLDQVQFIEGDIHDTQPGGPFDAITARLVLMYVPDPAAVLAAQARALRPGGLVVPIEFCLSTAGALPPTPLVTQVLSWLTQAFTRAGIDTSLGPRLWAVLKNAGLWPQGMIGVQPHFGPGDPNGAGLLAGIIRTAAPLIEQAGAATAAQIGADTLQQRLSSELHTAQAVFAHPILISTWATTRAT